MTVDLSNLALKSLKPIRPIALLRQLESELLDWISRARLHEPQDFATKLAIHTTEIELNNIHTELKALEFLDSPDDAAFSLSGPSIRNHSAPIQVVGQFLHHLQSLSNALAQAISGQVTLRGGVQQQVALEAMLNLTGTFDSSLGLKIARSPSREVNLYNSERPIEILGAIQAMLHPGDIGYQAALVACNSSPRVFSSYKEILSLSSKRNINISVRSRAHPFAVSITSEQASEREAWLSSQSSEEREEIMNGELEGTSLVSNWFELRVEGTVVKGHASTAACNTIRTEGLLGKRVLATVRTTVDSQADNMREPTLSHYLVQVSPYIPPDEQLYSHPDEDE